MTRGDLPSAVQAVQSAHAAVEHAAGNPGVAGCTLVMLAAPDEDRLQFLVQKLGWASVPVTCFREPDLDDQLTAIAVSDPAARRFLARLPLMLREGVSNNGARTEHVVAAG